MRKYILPALLIITALALTSVSCKSTQPAPTTEKKQETQPAKPQASVSVAGSAKVEEARKRAMDFEAPSYFPSEWEAVEAQYTALDGGAAENTLNSLAASYDDIFQKTIPLYAQAREDEIVAVREELVGTGFTKVFPEYLKIADDKALAAYGQYEAEDYYKAKETAADALDEYETLLFGAKVNTARQEIIDRGFIKYDEENFKRADDVAEAAIGKYDAGDKKGAIESAEEALLRYNIVITNSWVSYAGDRKKAASTERDNAIANKANIAVREGFRNADSLYNRAEDTFNESKFDEAAKLYIESEALFVLAADETEGKRQRAEEKIRMAEEKIEESVGAAIEAERIIEGGSR